MRRLTGALLAALALGGVGCADILGIEQRSYVSGASCETTADCEGNGSFCVAGRCGSTPADSALCSVLEPEEHENVSDFSFSSNSVVLGTMLLEGQTDDVPRVEAMRLGVEEMNRGVGIGEGRRLVMIGCDYTGGQGDVRAGLDYLAQDLGASVVIGATSSSSTEAAIGHIIANGHPTAFVSSFSTSPALSTISDDDLLWRTAPNDEGQAAVLGKIIVADPDVTKLAIIFVDDSYGSGLQVIVNSAVDETKDARPFSYDEGDVEEGFSTLVAEVSAYGPDGVLVIAVDPHNVVAIYQAMVDAGLSVNKHFLADAAKAEPLLDTGLDAQVIAIIESALGTAPYHSIAPHYETFADRLVGRGVDPDGTSFLAQSYDAAYLAGYGLAYAQSAEAPRDGHRVAEGFMRVIDPDASPAEIVYVGVNDFPGAVSVLSGDDPDRRIEIEGTGGPLDFEVTTGDAPGSYEIWRRDGDTFATCGVCNADDDVCDVSGCAL